MKKLGFGAMRLPLTDPKNPESIDYERTGAMIDAFMKAGFTYFDTAYIYHEGKSECALKDLLVKRYPRESFTLTDKLPLFKKPSAEQLPQLFDEQLRRCGVDFFDYYWIHCINTTTYAHAESVGAFEFVSKLKKEGKIRHIGFSFHDTAELLDEVLTKHPEMEYVQLQINYLDWEDPIVQSRACYEVCVKHNKPVLVMEPVKGGRLAMLPDEAEAVLRGCDPNASMASWAIRYAASLENVIVVLSGMSNMEQVLDNIGYMDDFKPLTQQEHDAVENAGKLIQKAITIGCTNCQYCTDGCPQRILIPTLFQIYNDFKMLSSVDKHNFQARYDECISVYGKASDCIGCGQCEEKCPQRLPIPKWLGSISEAFD